MFVICLALRLAPGWVFLASSYLLDTVEDYWTYKEIRISYSSYKLSNYLGSWEIFIRAQERKVKRKLNNISLSKCTTFYVKVISDVSRRCKPVMVEKCLVHFYILCSILFLDRDQLIASTNNNLDLQTTCVDSNMDMGTVMNMGYIKFVKCRVQKYHTNTERSHI